MDDPEIDEVLDLYFIQQQSVPFKLYTVNIEKLSDFTVSSYQTKLEAQTKSDLRSLPPMH